jgi:hypothetical protein
VISLLVAAAITIAGLATGGVVGRAINRTKRPAGDDVPSPSSDPAPPEKPPDRRAELLGGLPCALGDVVLVAGGEEAWLAGAAVFRERAAHRDEHGATTRTVAALFVSPDRGSGRAVYARTSPDDRLDLLSPIAGDGLAVGAEAPSALEHDGERFERSRRLPLLVEYVGEAAPDFGARAVLAEYDGGGGARLLIVVGTGATRVYAWRGRRLEPGLYEVLPAAGNDSK